MYDAFPDLPATYDSVPLYNNRRDIQFYVEEARDAGGSVLEVQDLFTVPLSELRELSTSTLPAAFGATISEPTPTVD